MHYALEIPEIQHIIFTFVFDDSLPRVRKRNLVSVAVTSQLFKNVALDILWRTLGNLVPLIKCLPEDLWHEETALDSEFSGTLVCSFTTSSEAGQLMYLIAVLHPFCRGQ